MATICEVCNDFRLPETTGEDGPDDILSIKIRSDEFNLLCNYCSVLHRMTLSFVPDLAQTSRSWFVHLDLECGQPANVKVCAENDDSENTEPYSTVTQFFVYLNAPCVEFPDLGCLLEPSSTAGEPSFVNFIRIRLEDCIQNHPMCGSGIPEHLPKRLLQFDLIENTDLRLIEHLDPSSKGIYATLSHCWGNGQPLRTESTNIDLMKQNIALAQLPPVFQNAVWLCQQLNITLLWIDSMCIIQNSSTDWEIESAKMSTYYQNAMINIAATGSDNCMVPFLRKRESKWLPRSYNFNSSVRIYARQHAGSSSLQNLEDFGPLTQRAWAYQETVLSKRVLHFTPSDLIWECKSALITEDGAIPRGLFSMRLTRLLENHSPDTNAFTIWHDLVGRYTTRLLTYETDRLPALSGLASRFQALTQAKYVAGMWHENLLNDLCWSTDSNASLSGLSGFVHDAYIAPSWAWSSITEPVVFADEGNASSFVPLAQIADVQCTVPGLNPFGRITSGYIQLTGKVQEITITIALPSDRYTYTIGNDPDLAEPFTADTVLTVEDGNPKRATSTDVLAPFSIPVPCMPIGKFQDDWGLFYYVLVLTAHTKDQYCRIGIAMLEDDEWFQEAPTKTLCIV